MDFLKVPVVLLCVMKLSTNLGELT